MTEHDNNHRQYEAYTRLFLRNEGKVRAFARAMMTSDAGVDDVVQEVALVAWRKFSDLKEGEEFGLWACVIARYEVLKWRRKHARDRLVFSEQTLNLLATAELESVDLRERERVALDACLESLPDDQRTLVMSVHTPSSSVARIAEETGQQAKRLYRKVSSLRLALLDCVNTQLAEEI
jgi:RNA polymerase sigma-70 factor, ECF subfamily